MGFSHRRVVCIGLSRFESLSRWQFKTFPGWDNNWAYHGDDGKKFMGVTPGQRYGPTFTAGDTVGCGVDFRNGTIYYTKNGQYLGMYLTVLCTRTTVKISSLGFGLC